MPIQDPVIMYDAKKYSITQISSIILKKLIDYSEIPNFAKLTHMDTKEALNFSHVLSCDPQNIVRIQGAIQGKFTVKVWNDQIKFKFLIPKFNEEISHYSRFNFFPNTDISKVLIEEHPDIDLTGEIILNFDIDEVTQKVQPKNINMIINNIKHFEVALENKFLHTIAIASCISDGDKSLRANINLNEFSKLNIGHENMIGCQFHQESFDSIVETIALMKENDVDSVRNKAMCMNIFGNRVTISMGGLTLFSSSNINKYKYITNYGLNIILSYLQTTGHNHRLPIMAQKKAFRKV